MRSIIFLFLPALGILSLQAQSGKQPDYNNIYYWAAHPSKNDPSDSIPSFIADKHRDSTTDVFFIHPTTYMGGVRANWNADIDDKELNQHTDERTILNQASVFNASCRIYAPRYRQAHLRVFFLPNNPNSKKALDTAYEDVRNAFRHYLAKENKGRPIIIASHSQGTYHAIRLLKEFFDGTPLQKQLVCAYIVGAQVEKNAFEHIPLGTQPDATGCFLAWRSYKNGFIGRDVKRENGNSACINPITWKADFKMSQPDQHKGGIGAGFSEKYSGQITAIVNEKTGILWVNLPEQTEKKFMLARNYHVADYNLFYFDIRENVKQRIAAFFSK